MTALERLCGNLVVCGIDGTGVDAALATRLRDGHRAGVILFARNVETLQQVRALNRDVCAASGADAPPIVSVDQEGGRVQRLRSPFPELPPMRELSRGAGGRSETTGPALDVAAIARVRDAARSVGRALRALGFTLDFAPVLDVDSNPENPVIGDRAFARAPDDVARLAGAFAGGLVECGVAPCGKHFPGHGDTDKDSHLDLPEVRHDLARLRSVELSPFRALAATLPSLMSAHVVYDALDPGVPATLSHRIATELLRDELGFQGVLFSDDLEMRALADRMSVEESAVRAVEAGCDVLLICKDGSLADRAHAALVAEAEKSAAFKSRCEQAARRSIALRRRFAPVRQADGAVLESLGIEPR